MSPLNDCGTLMMQDKIEVSFPYFVRLKKDKDLAKINVCHYIIKIVGSFVLFYFKKEKYVQQL